MHLLDSTSCVIVTRDVCCFGSAYYSLSMDSCADNRSKYGIGFKLDLCHVGVAWDGY